MIRKILSTQLRYPFSSRKIPTIGQVQKHWSDYSKGYNQFDHAPQTFFYSFMYMCEPWKAKNILEVACGTGKLIPFAMQVKRPQAKYLAVDLAQEMVELANQNTKANFQLYQSKLSYDEWLKTMNMEFRVANAEEPTALEDRGKFDRIICNCVLMLTSNPEKMLRNLHSLAEEGCLMGVSVWGDKAQNNLMMAIRETILEVGYELPEQRSNFHLYSKVDNLVEKCGWEIVLSWDQNALFPILEADGDKYSSLIFHQVDMLPEQYRKKAREILLGKVDAILRGKRGMNFSCKMLLLRKK